MIWRYCKGVDKTSRGQYTINGICNSKCVPNGRNWNGYWVISKKYQSRMLLFPLSADESVLQNDALTPNIEIRTLKKIRGKTVGIKLSTDSLDGPFIWAKNV